MIPTHLCATGSRLMIHWAFRKRRKSQVTIRLGRASDRTLDLTILHLSLGLGLHSSFLLFHVEQGIPTERGTALSVGADRRLGDFWETES